MLLPQSSKRLSREVGDSVAVLRFHKLANGFIGSKTIVSKNLPSTSSVETDGLSLGLISIIRFISANVSIIIVLTAARTTA